MSFGIFFDRGSTLSECGRHSEQRAVQAHDLRSEGKEAGRRCDVRQAGEKRDRDRSGHLVLSSLSPKKKGGRWVEAGRTQAESGEETKGSEEMRSVTSALRETWKKGKAGALKLVGLIVALTIERLSAVHGEIAVRKFCAMAAAHFEKTGHLPLLRKLSPTMRPVTESLQACDGETIAYIFARLRGMGNRYPIQASKK